MNAGITTVRGTNYETGSTSNHAGTTDEFFFFGHQVFGFDLECGRDFQPPVNGAVTAALEVAEAVKALGLCAMGETGLDVAALLERRQQQEPPVDSATATIPVLQSWNVQPLPPDDWRRFRVHFDALADTQHA